MALFPPRPTINANYDWIDLVSATGYIIFDGLNAKSSVGNNYILIDSSHAKAITSKSEPRGDVLLSSFVVGSGQDADLDFDLSAFQLPRTIEGIGFAKITVSAHDTDAIEGVYVKARLRKYSTVTGESEIVTVQSPTQASIAATKYESWTLRMIIPKTHFKQGETLRLTVEIWSTDAHALFLAHNPSDTAVNQFDAGTSRLTLAIPFKLDFM